MVLDLQEEGGFTREAIMRPTVALVFAVAALAAFEVRAEASHHQVGSGVGPISTLGIDSNAQLPTEWHFQVFPSILSASDKFDDAGSRTSLLDLSSVTNYSLNIFAERRFGERWSVSALTAWQLVLMDNSGSQTEFHSLADSWLNVRYSIPNSLGTLSAIGSVKIPGTYPESEATSTKQVDAEAKAAMAFTSVFPRVSAVLSAGYRLRLGMLKDEVTGALLFPVDVGAGLTITPTLAGAYAVGLGDLAKDAVSAGASATWTLAQELQFVGSWSRTLWGHNVVVADLVTVGIGTAF